MECYEIGQFSIVRYIHGVNCVLHDTTNETSVIENKTYSATID